jgi:hypothetical protein
MGFDYYEQDYLIVNFKDGTSREYYDFYSAQGRYYLNKNGNTPDFTHILLDVENQALVLYDNGKWEISVNEGSISIWKFLISKDKDISADNICSIIRKTRVWERL